MSLNEEPNQPDPVLRAFTEMIDATFVKRPTADQVRAAEAEGNLRDALRDLDEQIKLLLGLLHELRRIRRDDDFRPF